MTMFQVSALRPNSVWTLYRLKNKIQMDPIYQRDGDIWNLEKRQLLIDTIINRFDMPKIYLHKFTGAGGQGGAAHDYAVIDGKQRLEATWSFIDGKFALSEEFVYLRGENDGQSIKLAGLTYADLAQKYPDIKSDFDAYQMDVMCIETSDVDAIEELFSRLNEAVPLSAPEKRNASTGPLPPAVRSLSDHEFFSKCLPFTNRRYRHYDLAAKMLLIMSKDDVADTKKVYLDDFFKRGGRRYSASMGPKVSHSMVRKLTVETLSILDCMSQVFTKADPLLRQVGMTILYFHLFRKARSNGQLAELNRGKFQDFEDSRIQNRKLAEDNISQADYDLLEFDRYTQSPNDAYAIKIRLSVIDKKVFGNRLQFGVV